MESVDSRIDRAATEYAELRQDSSTDIASYYQNFKLAVKKYNDLQVEAAAKLTDLAGYPIFQESFRLYARGNQVEFDSGSPSFPKKTAQAVFQRVVNHTPRFTSTIKSELASTVMSVRTTKQKTRSDKFCSYHKCKGHSDAECNAQKKPSSSASFSVPPTTSAPRTSTGQYAAVVVPDDEEELLETYNGLMAFTHR
jgi:hypothetical protein